MENGRHNFGDDERAYEAEYDTFENEGPDEDRYTNESGVDDGAVIEPLDADQSVEENATVLGPLGADQFDDDAGFMEPLGEEQSNAGPLGFDRYDEEFAAEVAEPGVSFREDDDAEVQGNPFIGYLSVAIAILSLFVWPVVLGPAAVVTGMISYARGSKGMGIAGIVIGIISFVGAILLFPYS